MIAKVIAWGRDRPEARARLSRALRQTATVISGGTTNKGFLLDLLDRPEFVRGEVDTTWLDTMMADGYAPPRRIDVALLATAFEAYEAHARRQQDRLFTSAERGRPEVGHETWHQADVRVGSEAYQLRVSRPRPARYRVDRKWTGPHGGGRRRAVGPVRAHPRRRRPALRRALGRAGPGLPRRGRRSGAPDLRRRGRAGPRPGPGHGGGHNGRRRRRGRGGRRRGRRGEHEAGDGVARPGGRPDRRGARRRQHPGRDRRQAGQDRAGSGLQAGDAPRVRCPGRPERAAPARAETSATRQRPPPTRWRPCAPWCSASTSMGTRPGGS